MYSWSLFFFLFEMSLCHHCFKDSFAGYDIFFFFCSTYILSAAFGFHCCHLFYCSSIHDELFFSSFFQEFVFQQVGCDVSMYRSLSIYLLGIYWASWICQLFSIICEKFSAIALSNIFLCPFLSFPSGIPITHKSVNLMLSHRSLRLCSFLSFFSLFYLLKSTT